MPRSSDIATSLLPRSAASAASRTVTAPCTTSAHAQGIRCSTCICTYWVAATWDGLRDEVRLSWSLKRESPQSEKSRGSDHGLVPKKGLEPPHPCGYMDLNHARLPIPPLRHGIVTSEKHRPLFKEQIDCTG